MTTNMGDSSERVGCDKTVPPTDARGQTTALLRRLWSADWGALFRGFWEYNILRRFRTVPLRELVIEVTYRCNSRCVMCNIWQAPHKAELTLEQFDRILSDPLFRTVERLLLAGGEPTLRSDLPELARICSTHMPSLRSITVVTNGLWPERVLSVCEEIARRCAQHSPRPISLTISVSLDGLADVHNRIRNVPDAFDRAVETVTGLQKLQEQYSFHLGVACVICHLNLNHLDEFADWCRQHGLSYGFQLVGFHDTHVANMAQRPVLDFDEADRPVLHRVLEKLAGEKSLTNTMACYWQDMLHMYRDGRERQSPCPFLVDAAALSPYGDLRPCETEGSVGNCLDAVARSDAPDADGHSQAGCSRLYYSPQMAAMRQAMARGVCRFCNSGCMVNVGWRKDTLRYLRSLLGK